MTDQPRCETCRFVKAHKWYKPFAAITGDYEMVDYYLCCIRSVPKFPERQPNDFCGEHQLKEPRDE